MALRIDPLTPLPSAAVDWLPSSMTRALEASLVERESAARQKERELKELEEVLE